jgi:hypothetical protein
VTTASRIEALERLGYTEREAQFLELAALHSGYFLRRQFNTFIGHKRGGTAAAFVKKLREQAHASFARMSKRTVVYHLGAKPLYAALGQADNRHRRRRPSIGIKAKLMALDYVLAHRVDRFLATEQERTEYFLGIGIARAALPCVTYRRRKDGPTTSRYFVDKRPMSVHDHVTPSAVSLTYIDPGAWSVEGLETYLKQYAQLIQSLQNVRLVYVADTDRNFAAAAALFERWRQPILDAFRVPKDAAEMARMLAHFETRYWAETKQLAKVTIARLEQYHPDRAIFHGSAVERLFAMWKDGGEAAVREWLADAPARALDPVVTFATYRLPHDYSFLGTMGGAW